MRDEQQLKDTLSKILEKDVSTIEKTTFIKIIEQLVEKIEEMKKPLLYRDTDMSKEEREKFIMEWKRLSNEHYGKLIRGEK